MARDASLTAVAKITAAIGLAGDVRVQLLCDGPERLKRITDAFVGLSPNDARPASVARVSIQGNGVLIRFSGVDDRTAAARLRNLYLFVGETDAAKPREGSYPIDELLGCTVTSVDGTVLGTIRDVYNLPGHDAWGVWTGKEEVMVPAVKAWVHSVDVKARRVVLTPAEGMFP